MALGRNTGLVSSLLELSALNFLFGLTGIYLPRKSRKLTALSLMLIAVAQMWVAWGLFFG